MAESTYDTVSDVRRGADVQVPGLTEDDQFVVVKVIEGDEVTVTLFNLQPQEALDALMGVVMAIGGGQ